MGPYCEYCGHRCFVPDVRRVGWLKATCGKGRCASFGQHLDARVSGHSLLDCPTFGRERVGETTGKGEGR